jgi:hypothetical protein
MLDLAPLALFKILNVPGTPFVSQSNLVSLLNKVLTLVSNTIQSLVLLKCMPIKQTMRLGGTRDIKLLPDYSSGINSFLQLLQVVISWKNLFMLGKMNPITDQVEVNLLGIEDGIHPLTFHRM